MQTRWPGKPADILGARVGVFGPWRANVYAGYVLAALFLALGLTMFVWGVSHVPDIARAPNPEARKDAGGNFVTGLLCLFLVLPAAISGYLARNLSRTRLEIHENGFVWRSDGGNTALWSDVVRIEERFVSEQGAEELLGVAGSFFPPTIARMLVVVHRDGRQFIFDRETIHLLGRLKKLLKPIAESRGIPWTVEDRT